MTAITPTVPGPLSSPDANQARVRQAARAFEALLVQSLVKTMRQAQLDGGLFGKGTGSSNYEAMFDRQLADSLAERSPLGIADMLEAQWSRRSSPADAREAIRAIRQIEARAVPEFVTGRSAIPPEGRSSLSNAAKESEIQVSSFQDDKNDESPVTQEGNEHED